MAVPVLRARYGLPEIKRGTVVDKTLCTPRALVDPEFAHAVLELYARTKLTSGRTKVQVELKLEHLERRHPRLADNFHSVRSDLGLRPSRILEAAPPPPYTKECSCACTCGAAEPDEWDLRRQSVLSLTTASALERIARSRYSRARGYSYASDRDAPSPYSP